MKGWATLNHITTNCRCIGQNHALYFVVRSIHFKIFHRGFSHAESLTSVMRQYQQVLEYYDI